MRFEVQMTAVIIHRSTTQLIANHIYHTPHIVPVYYWAVTKISMLPFEGFNIAAKVYAFPLKDIIDLCFIQCSRIFLRLEYDYFAVQNDRRKLWNIINVNAGV